MAATTTPEISLIINKLRNLYPDIQINQGARSAWHPSTNSVTYSKHPANISELLHEMGHAILGHSKFDRDINLLVMERDAWTEAERIADNIGIAIDDNYAHEHLETYRDWLHARSTCPDCASTGIEIATAHYQCLSCGTKWRVNDARRCGLKRYRV